MRLFRKPSQTRDQGERIVALMSDTHGGHKLGLMNPDVLLYEQDEEGTPTSYSPESTATQVYLWNLYNEHIGQVAALAGEREIVVLHCGDATHGDRYPQQLVRTDKASQILIAVANWAPWMALEGVHSARLVVGTGAHNFDEGTAEVLIVEQLKALYPGRNWGVVWHGLVSIDGVLIDYAHHGPSPGIRIWTSGNQARYYLRSLMLEEIAAGRMPPMVVVRGHYHEPIIERVQCGTFESWIVILPAYCGLSDHGHQVTRSRHTIHNGMMALRISDDKLRDIEPFCASVDLRTKEEL